MAARKSLFFALPLLAASLAAAVEEYQPLHPGAGEAWDPAWQRVVSDGAVPPAGDGLRRNVVRLKLPALPQGESRVRLVEVGETPSGSLDFSPIRPESRWRAQTEAEAIPGLITSEQLALDQFDLNGLAAPLPPPEAIGPEPEAGYPDGEGHVYSGLFADEADGGHRLRGNAGLGNDFFRLEPSEQPERIESERKREAFSRIELPPPLNEKAVRDSGYSGKPPVSQPEALVPPALPRPPENISSPRLAENAPPRFSSDVFAPGSLRPPANGDPAPTLRPPASLEMASSAPSNQRPDGLRELLPFPGDGLTGTASSRQTPAESARRDSHFQRRKNNRPENRPAEIFPGYNQPVKWSELIPPASASPAAAGDKAAMAPETVPRTSDSNQEAGAAAEPEDAGDHDEALLVSLGHRRAEEVPGCSGTAGRGARRIG